MGGALMGVDGGMTAGTPGEHDCAEALMSAVLKHHGIAPDGPRVRVSTCDTAAVVQVNLIIQGEDVRAQATGVLVAEAISAAALRLAHQVAILTRGGGSWPWPDPARPPWGLDRPGRIGRVKHVPLVTCPPGRAARTMHVMDYDVHLFNDAETGEDAVVYRCGPTGVRLARQNARRPIADADGRQFTVSPLGVGVHTPEEAADLLCAGTLPHLFFTDAATGRGNLLYRRHDGDLTLITPGEAS